MNIAHECTTLVLGSGIAGLTYACKAAEHGDVLIMTKKRPAESNTNYAQGGIASVTDARDSFELHVQDTLEAGAGLCRREAVEYLVREGPARIQELIERGARFSRTEEGELELGREGGHSARRIVHAKDLTGREVERALLWAVEQDPRIRILENHFALDLWVGEDPASERTSKNAPANAPKNAPRRKRCFGATFLSPETGEIAAVRARRTLLSTGGGGKIYLYTTNPDIATGDGIAMAARAGCAIVNLEFVQFHPTCLYHPQAKSFLISEAVRGEGAILRNLAGDDFMQGMHELASLAPRDIVAREIDRQMKRRGDKFVLLDCSPIGPARFEERFPTIATKLREFGLRPGIDPIPVVPAAHYMCGGVGVDLDGRTEIEALFAVGEAACTGVHGANRLASNSLLEALVFADRAARIPPPPDDEGHAPEPPGGGRARVREEEGVIVDHDWDAVRRTLWDFVGLVRSMDRLDRAIERLAILRKDAQLLWDRSRPTPDLGELRNIALVGLLLAESARARHESRGLHFLSDYPDTDPVPRETWARLRGEAIAVELQELPWGVRAGGTS
jgi:L-aspartate oxidase